MLEATLTPCDHAHLTSVQAPHAGDVILAVPMTVKGTRFDPQQLCIADALRFSTPTTLYVGVFAVRQMQTNMDHTACAAENKWVGTQDPT